MSLRKFQPAMFDESPVRGVYARGLGRYDERPGRATLGIGSLGGHEVPSMQEKAGMPPR